MFDLIDRILIARRIGDDDWTLSSRRVDGQPGARVIYFLPWNTSYRLARHAGFLPLPFLAAYEAPPSIVSSDPKLCVAAVNRLADDAVELVRANGLKGSDVLVVGLSVGTYPATYLANRLGARLCSVTSADRGDLMIWQSPAAWRVKQRALARGYCLLDYARALRGYNPIENLKGLASGSTFMIGVRDLLVPLPRSQKLVDAARSALPRVDVITTEAGHVRTLGLSAAVQRKMFTEAFG